MTQVLERAVTAEVPFGWVTGDCVYGRDRQLRQWLEQHRRPYVLGVQSTTLLAQDAHRALPAKIIAQDIPVDQWQRLSAGDGRKARAGSTGPGRRSGGGQQAMTQRRGASGCWCAGV